MMVTPVMFREIPVSHSTKTRNYDRLSSQLPNKAATPQDLNRMVPTVVRLRVAVGGNSETQLPHDSAVEGATRAHMRRGALVL